MPCHPQWHKILSYVVISNEVNFIIVLMTCRSINYKQAFFCIIYCLKQFHKVGKYYKNAI